VEGALTLRSARCQSAYWDKGKLRIVNYLTGGVFAANPILLEVIRFFFSPKTIREAMLEFDAYSPESVGEMTSSIPRGSHGCRRADITFSQRTRPT